MECVERTQAVAKAMAEKQFELAVELRGRSFARNLETYKMLTRLKPPKEAFDSKGKPIVRFLIFFPSIICDISLTQLFSRKGTSWLLCTLVHQHVV